MVHRALLEASRNCVRRPGVVLLEVSALTQEQAVEVATHIWDSINGPNLVENVAPTRGRATLVLRKDADHSVRYVRLRKL